MPTGEDQSRRLQPVCGIASCAPPQPSLLPVLSQILLQDPAPIPMRETLCGHKHKHEHATRTTTRSVAARGAARGCLYLFPSPLVSMILLFATFDSR